MGAGRASGAGPPVVTPWGKEGAWPGLGAMLSDHRLCYVLPDPSMPSRFPCLKLGEIRIGKSRFPPKCLDHPSVSRAARAYSGSAEWYDELVLLLREVM